MSEKVLQQHNFRLAINFYAVVRVGSWCKVFEILRRENQEDDKEEESLLGNQEHEDRGGAGVSTTVYVNRRKSWRLGRIAVTVFSRRQMTPITTLP